ncbi:ATP-binding cassette domain-containing protein [Duganella sp. FT94W]|uniref:ATP-binding cassette domain-containing protein n=1 Tax=Duganella lactea TaxID=2692173 RepID=A0ABW9V7A0_9BURK|nr:ABC transporter ATP-binding protein [Duganella lactea]MYM34645.1 ATP-binding cassette domain-containing protein [Duganella lactea]
MLELRNVVKVYGKNVRAVDDVSLELPSGVTALIGHNGAGKTTLMQMIATIARPTSGQILLEGVDIVQQPDAMRTRLGFLPQDFGVYPNLTALEFMQYFAALKGVRDPARIRRLLELVNLHDHADRHAAGFSGGMKRRLGIAQALLNDPDVLIVDEPTAGLDPEERLRFRHLLSEIGLRKLVLLSTHIVSDIENMAGRLAVMNQGRLVACDTPDSFVQRARSQVWSVTVPTQDYERLSAGLQVLQAQRHADGVTLRIAHSSVPLAGALPTEPTLEEALMTQRYAVRERQDLAA